MTHKGECKKCSRQNMSIVAKGLCGKCYALSRKNIIEQVNFGSNKNESEFKLGNKKIKVEFNIVVGVSNLKIVNVEVIDTTELDSPST